MPERYRPWAGTAEAAAKWLWGDHGQQDQRFLPLGEAAGLLQGLGAGNGFGIAAHKSTSFPLVFILTKLAFMCFAFLTILY